MVLLALTALAVLSRNGATKKISLCLQTRLILNTTAMLEREHERLVREPFDREAHAAHRDKLRQHIQDLHAHLERMRSRLAE